MLYSSTIFIVYPTALFGFMCIYFSDKFLLLNFNQRSKQFDDLYHQKAFLYLMPVAPIIHTIGCHWQLKIWHLEMLPLYEKGATGDSKFTLINSVISILILMAFAVWKIYNFFVNNLY